MRDKKNLHTMELHGICMILSAFSYMDVWLIIGMHQGSIFHIKLAKSNQILVIKNIIK